MFDFCRTFLNIIIQELTMMAGWMDEIDLFRKQEITLKGISEVLFILREAYINDLRLTLPSKVSSPRVSLAHSS